MSVKGTWCMTLKVMSHRWLSRCLMNTVNNVVCAGILYLWWLLKHARLAFMYSLQLDREYNGKEPLGLNVCAANKACLCIQSSQHFNETRRYFLITKYLFSLSIKFRELLFSCKSFLPSNKNSFLTFCPRYTPVTSHCRN